ncbi:peptide ABC transporter (plasmid) [Brevibacillus laterosporus]|uniref:Peptide ABC transporter n=1 Tax=Brevibacillus laterosporus TaxID=1465 RepID=A0A0F7C1W5_BRELA|nr:peptide ABC transporter [Brevibacillus laterosporus]
MFGSNSIGHATGNNPDLPIQEIEKIIQKNMEIGKIPGLSVVIISQENTVFQKSYGYADLQKMNPVTSQTLFELGSNSKSFTSLGILLLEKQELISLKDPVSKYLPWFKLKWKDTEPPITIEHLLHHTSGVAFETIGDIPQSKEEDALEQTVKSILSKELKYKPGTKFEYATVNYDVLGLLIEKVTGQRFDRFMKEQIIKPLGLHNTYVGLMDSELEKKEIATGYKLGYTKNLAYKSPPFYGNTPAGYFISSPSDMAEWLKIQMGTSKQSLFDPLLIQKSHLPNRSVHPDIDGSSYAAGWYIFQKGSGEISHSGANPNFSSFIVIRPSDKLGVAVFANLNSDYTEVIGQGIINLIQGIEAPRLHSDTYKEIDQIATAVLCSLVLLFLVTLYFTVRLLVELLRKKRIFIVSKNALYVVIVATVLLAVFGYSLYKIPTLFFYNLPWSFVEVWGPNSIMVAVYGAFAVGFAYYVYFVLSMLFQKSNDKGYFTLLLLSIISGFGNAFIIFVINETFVRSNNLTNGLLFYFLLGILMYVFSQKYIRSKLVRLTNGIVYEKRKKLINRLLNTPFYKLEKLEKGRIEATLNNDTEMISRSINVGITSATSLITLLCCFIYLGIMNGYALLLSIFIIGVTLILYSFIGNQADKLWEQTRDIQNSFFRFISDLMGGFKELTLNFQKRQEFKKVMLEKCDRYRDKRTLGDLKFANVFVIGELLFVIVIGIVVFVFPEFFKDIQKETLRNYVFVFLYMVGPVNELLNGIPHILQVKISWKRINSMLEEVGSYEISGKDNGLLDIKEQNQIVLQLKDVKYSYQSENQKAFEIGSISYEFRAGEITYITGGNGSGKSTLAKLITGLYPPDEGEININGVQVNTDTLNQQYSAIFSDFYLFDRMYGIQADERKNEIQAYLKMLELEDKIKIENGVFSTIKLSSGQKKRLALLITYLEDRPICLFDEWAADQDPEYRRFFYTRILPELKMRGKCVIVITHDVHYFNLADHVIKMDMGQIVQNDTIHVS